MVGYSNLCLANEFRLIIIGENIAIGNEHELSCIGIALISEASPTSLEIRGGG